MVAGTSAPRRHRAHGENPGGWRAQKPRQNSPRARFPHTVDKKRRPTNPVVTRNSLFLRIIPVLFSKKTRIMQQNRGCADFFEKSPCIFPCSCGFLQIPAIFCHPDRQKNREQRIKSSGKGSSRSAKPLLPLLKQEASTFFFKYWRCGGSVQLAEERVRVLIIQNAVAHDSGLGAAWALRFVRGLSC
jgi:hypothetical protein